MGDMGAEEEGDEELDLSKGGGGSRKRQEVRYRVRKRHM